MLTELYSFYARVFFIDKMSFVTIEQHKENDGGLQSIGTVTGRTVRVVQKGAEVQNIGDVVIRQDGSTNDYLSGSKLVDGKLMFWFKGDIVFNDFLVAKGNNILFYGNNYKRDYTDCCEVHGESMKIDSKLVVGNNFTYVEQVNNKLVNTRNIIGVCGIAVVLYVAYKLYY